MPHKFTIKILTVFTALIWLAFPNIALSAAILQDNSSTADADQNAEW